MSENIAGLEKESLILPCSTQDRNLSLNHLCEESLIGTAGGTGGNWSSCSSKMNMKLMVYAECKTSHVTLPSWNPFQKENLNKNNNERSSKEGFRLESYQIGSLLSFLDGVLMILILIFLFWLEAKETEEINMSTEGICTGGDYTVFTAYLPYHHDMAQLKRQLAKFLEKELSNAPPVFRDGPVEVSTRRGK